MGNLIKIREAEVLFYSQIIYSSLPPMQETGKVNKQLSVFYHICALVCFSSYGMGTSKIDNTVLGMA